MPNSLRHHDEYRRENVSATRSARLSGWPMPLRSAASNGKASGDTHGCWVVIFMVSPRRLCPARARGWIDEIGQALGQHQHPPGGAQFVRQGRLEGAVVEVAVGGGYRGAAAHLAGDGHLE